MREPPLTSHLVFVCLGWFAALFRSPGIAVSKSFDLGVAASGPLCLKPQNVGVVRWCLLPFLVRRLPGLWAPLRVRLSRACFRPSARASCSPSRETSLPTRRPRGFRSGIIPQRAADVVVERPGELIVAACAYGFRLARARAGRRITGA